MSIPEEDEDQDESEDDDSDEDGDKDEEDEEEDDGESERFVRIFPLNCAQIVCKLIFGLINGLSYLCKRNEAMIQ